MNNLGERFAGIAFSHAFQPIVSFERKAVYAYEVLLRGAAAESPGSVFQQILPAQLMVFDQFSRERALAKAAQLGVTQYLNLNFTPGSVTSSTERFIERTLRCIERVGLATEQLVVELTESECVQDLDKLKVRLNELRSQGVTIAIDDFGAGYAGLNMLAAIQPDLLKIDRGLIQGIGSDGPRQAIIRGTCDVCLDLGIEVLAEGVETLEEFEFLQGLGIDLYQGYLLARPGFECLPPVDWPC